MNPRRPIVLVGARMSWPGNYRNLKAALEEVSGAKVFIAAINPLDWISGRIKGYGQLVFEVATTVDRALIHTGASKAVLIGHSEGGIACRIYLGGDPPFGGRRFSGHRRISHLITLGTPHLATAERAPDFIREANSLFPGTIHAASGMKYISVAGNAVDGSLSSQARKHYEKLVPDGRMAGDGRVPVDSAILPGSQTIILEGVNHSSKQGRWYGSDTETVLQWWPPELHLLAEKDEA